MELNGLAQVAADDATEPRHVLHVKWLVKAVRRAQLRDLILGGARAKHHPRRIARRQARDREYQY